MISWIRKEEMKWSGRRASCLRCNISISIEIEQVSGVVVVVSISILYFFFWGWKFQFRIISAAAAAVECVDLYTFFCHVELIKWGHKMSLIWCLICHSDQHIHDTQLDSNHKSVYFICFKCQMQTSKHSRSAREKERGKGAHL